MDQYVKQAKVSFTCALSALGTWCTGVTSTDKNVRSEMYEKMVKSIRGHSSFVRFGAQAILECGVHGMWWQLVEDFSIEREEYTTEEISL